jgi:biotin carboxylase
MRDNRKVLILNAESSMVLPFCWYYNKVGYKVIGCANDIPPLALFSRAIHYRTFIKSPNEFDEVNKRLFVNKIERLRKKIGTRLVLAFAENVVEPIIKYRNKIKAENIYPSYRSYSILFYKDKLKRYIEMRNPRSFLIPKSFDKENIKFPCVVKPNIGSGGDFVTLCNSLSELRVFSKIIKQNNRVPIVEEYIPYKDRIAMNLLIDRNFKVKVAVTRAVVSVERIKEIIYELEDFFKKIKYFGFASPQFLLKNGNLYLTEINPRLSGIPYGIDFGANLPGCFHLSIIEKRNIEERFIFLPKKYRGNIVKYSTIFLCNFQDLIPIIITINEYLYWRGKRRIKIFFSKKYKKWFRFS